jgi:hypothetical protein
MGEPSFSSVFAKDFAVREAIYALISDADGPVDPVAMVGRLRERYPEVELPASELLRTVVQAARDAGVPVIGGHAG